MKTLIEALVVFFFFTYFHFLLTYAFTLLHYRGKVYYYCIGLRLLLQLLVAE